MVFCICYLMLGSLRHRDLHRVRADSDRGPCMPASCWGPSQGLWVGVKKGRLGRTWHAGCRWRKEPERKGSRELRTPERQAGSRTTVSRGSKPLCACSLVPSDFTYQNTNSKMKLPRTSRRRLQSIKPEVLGLLSAGVCPDLMPVKPTLLLTNTRCFNKDLSFTEAL